jgi:hypothetical protein
MTHEPIVYEYLIQVEGAISTEWQDWFGGMQISRQGDITNISGRLPDQTAVYGILNRLAGLNLALISVQRTSSE